MPEFCTCGAQLPPDARFCHKCGKPQYDFMPVEEEAQPEPAPPLPVVADLQPLLVPSDISFHNGLAVRIGFIAAMGAVFVLMIPLPLPLLRLLLAPIAAGYFAVFLYSRRTGQSLSIRGGRRMGWITGIFSFTIVGILSTFAIAALSNQGGLTKYLRDQFPANDPNTEAVLRSFNDPTMVGLFMLACMAFLFVILTSLPMLGGVLGAKVLEKQ